MLLFTAIEQLSFLEVHTALYQARSKWYFIGMLLGIHPTTLECIKIEERRIEQQYSKMLSTWLRNSDDRSWKALAKVLRSPVVGRSDIAAQIEDKYRHAFRN